MHLLQLRRHVLFWFLFMGFLTMRYLLHETQRHELHARQQYLFDVFRMYFLPGKPEGGFIPLKPIGILDQDILFITGHTDHVFGYLENNIDCVPESIIVITSCLGLVFRRYVKKKKIFVPDLEQLFCRLHDGQPYGFSFKISDAELDFYNAQGTALERIQAAYKRLV